MNYMTLYETWKKEKETSELQRLDKRFFVELSEHVRTHRDEVQMLDEKTLSAKLASEERARIDKLLIELLWTRYGKIIKVASRGKQLPIDLLTPEEVAIYRGILTAYEKVKKMEKDLLRGHVPRFDEAKDQEELKRTLLVRILQALPAIIGSNMKVYGPFKAEDIAALPVENAESLIKRGIAVKVDIE